MKSGVRLRRLGDSTFDMLKLPFMAQIFPFQPYRYKNDAGRLSDLVTQPYDKITPEMRKRYLSLSPNNLVRVILGEPQPGDNHADNV